MTTRKGGVFVSGSEDGCRFGYRAGPCRPPGRVPAIDIKKKSYLCNTSKRRSPISAINWTLTPITAEGRLGWGPGAPASCRHQGASVAGRDMRPAAHSLSFASPKESKQRKGDPTVRVPFAALRGNLRCSFAGRAAELTARYALRSNNCGKSVNEGVCPSAHARPAPCASRHGQKGTQQHGPSLRSPRSGAALARGRAQRWPVPGCSPPVAAPGAGRLRGEHARRSAHASLSDLPQLFERSAPARSEFCGTPRKRPDTGVPRSAAKGSQTWGRVLCLLSCTSKKGGRPPGRVPASRHQKIELLPHNPQGPKRYFSN